MRRGAWCVATACLVSAVAPAIAPANAQETPPAAAVGAVVHDPALLPADRAAAVDAAAAATVADTPIPGLSLALVIDGRVAYAHGYGWADVEQQVPATARTSYAWASISKLMAATAAGQLAAAGTLDLDADIRTYVPEWPAHAAGVVTARRCLTHQSGIPHYGGGTLRFDDPHHYASGFEALAKFRDAPLRFAPGTRTAYSTFAFTLLGCAVARASGGRYRDYVQRHVFDPAGMTTARVDDPTTLIPDRARGYRVIDGVLSNVRPHDPSYKLPGGGIRGSAVDLARFLAATLQGRLVSAETFAAMRTPALLADGTPTHRGLGWQLTDHLRAHRLNAILVGHGGAQTGVSTWCFVIPAARFGVALLADCERQGGPLYELSYRLLAIAGPASALAKTPDAAGAGD